VVVPAGVEAAQRTALAGHQAVVGERALPHHAGPYVEDVFGLVANRRSGTLACILYAIVLGDAGDDFGSPNSSNFQFKKYEEAAVSRLIRWGSTGRARTLPRNLTSGTGSARLARKVVENCSSLPLSRRHHHKLGSTRFARAHTWPSA
jgi:hypothetical protein